MATLIAFFGTAFATSQTETFVGNGTADTVSYALVGTGVNIGNYTSGISVNLATGIGSLGWALGDTFVGVENLVGSQHSDLLIGNDQPNILDGGGSPDTIYAAGGADRVLGAGGFDFLYGDAGNDVMDGQWQTDKLYGGDGDDRIWGGSNYINHFYPGTNYADVLYGDGGNDQLHGDVRVLTGWTEYDPSLDFMPGADEIHGGPGNDTLNGDGGNDTLWGDTGADRFEFDARYVVKAVNGSNFAITHGGDVVKDFRPWEGDRLDLNGQSYTVADNSAGYLISTPYGLILLEGIHSFSPDWIVP